MKINLKDYNNQKLNHLFAEKVCGWKYISDPVCGYKTENGFVLYANSSFTSDFNLILPQLEKYDEVGVSFIKESGFYYVDIAKYLENDEFESYEGKSLSLKKSAMIALFRANGIEVIEE